MVRKATSTETEYSKGTIETWISERAEYHPETREYLGPIWVCEGCGGRDTRDETQIEHREGCPKLEDRR